MAKITTSNLNMAIPAFLYDEIVRLLKKKNQDANMKNVSAEINFAIMTYIINCESEEKLKEDLNDYKEILKEGFYKLSYLISKNFGYELLKDNMIGVINEEIMKTLSPKIEKQATEIAVDSMAKFLSYTSKGDDLKEMENTLKVKLASGKPKVYKGEN